MADVVLRASKEKVLVLHSTNIEHIEQILKAASTPPNNDKIRIKLDAKTEKFLKNYPDKSKLNYFTKSRLNEDNLTGKQTSPTAKMLKEAEEDVKKAQEAANKMATEHSAAEATLAKAADVSKSSAPGIDSTAAAQAKIAAEAGVTAALHKKTEAEKALQEALEKQKTVKKGAADAQEGAGLKAAAIEAAKKEAAQFKADVSAKTKHAKPPTV